MAKRGSNAVGEATTQATAALDQLFSTPPRDFVASRARFVAELRAAGDAPGAKALAAARRPPPSAWALNVVAREHAGAMAGYVHAAERLRAAQRETIQSDDANPFAVARREAAEHEANVLGLAKAALVGAGLPWTPLVRRRVAGTLRAVALAGSEDRAQLLAGRLQGDLDAPSDFEALAASLGPSARAPKERGAPELAAAERAPRKATKSATEDHAARRRQAKEAAARRTRERETKAEEMRRAREARARASELESAAREREQHAKALGQEAVQAEQAAARARAAAETAKKAADEARAEAKAARDALERR